MIVIEGIDGIGKSTLAYNVAKEFISCVISPKTILQEGLLGEQTEREIELKTQFNSIMQKLKTTKDYRLIVYYYNCIMVIYLELLGIISDRIKEIEKDKLVIADRWNLSSLAYNGSIDKTFVGRLLKSNNPFISYKDKLDLDEWFNKDRVNKINNMILEYNKKILVPKITIVLNGKVKNIWKRIDSRDNDKEVFEDFDRLKKTKHCYKKIIKAYNTNKDDTIIDLGQLYIVKSADKKSEKEILKEVLDVIYKAFNYDRGLDSEVL